MPSTSRRTVQRGDKGEEWRGATLVGHTLQHPIALSAKSSHPLGDQS